MAVLAGSKSPRTSLTTSMGQGQMSSLLLQLQGSHCLPILSLPSLRMGASMATLPPQAATTTAAAMAAVAVAAAVTTTILPAAAPLHMAAALPPHPLQHICTVPVSLLLLQRGRGRHRPSKKPLQLPVQRVLWHPPLCQQRQEARMGARLQALQASCPPALCWPSPLLLQAPSIPPQPLVASLLWEGRASLCPLLQPTTLAL